MTLAFNWDGEHGFIDDRLNSDIATNAERNNLGGTIQDRAIWPRLVLINGSRLKDNGSFRKLVLEFQRAI